MITIKDANGNYVPIEAEELSKVVVDNLSTLFGMDVAAIIEFRKIMMLEGFSPDVSAKDVKDFYDRTKKT